MSVPRDRTLMKRAIASPKEAPFPLRRYFYLFVLPGLLVVISTVILATTETVRSSTVEILLQIASRRVEGIAKGLESVAPAAWHKLLPINRSRHLILLIWPKPLRSNTP